MNNEPLIRYVGNVISNNDPKRQGRVKIRVAALHGEMSIDKLPWARPSRNGTGGSATSGISMIPEVGTYVWVFFERHWFKQNAYYEGNVEVDGLNSFHTLFDTAVAPQITSGSFSSSYPNVKFMRFQSGMTIGVGGGTTPEMVCFHPSGGYILINSAGKIYIKGPGVPTQKTLLGEDLKDLLDDLLDAILALTVPTGVGPSGPPINSSDFSNIKAQLPTVLSNVVQNN